MPQNSRMQYGTFWQRSVASLLDFLVILPVFLLIWYLAIVTEHPSRLSQLSAFLAIASLYPAYTIYCHGRYGKTLGKRTMGICIADKSGSPIRWVQAWHRSAVDIIFLSLGFILFATTLLLAPDNVFYTTDWMQREKAIQSLEPKWASWLDWADLVWAVSESITMLFNSKRRALHDLIAGTIVIRQAQPTQSSSDS